MSSERVSTFLESLYTFYTSIFSLYLRQPIQRIFTNSHQCVCFSLVCSFLAKLVVPPCWVLASVIHRTVVLLVVLEEFLSVQTFLYQHLFFDSASLLVFYLCICQAVTTKTKRQWISGAEQKMSIIGESKQDGLTMMFPCKNTTPVFMEPMLEEADLPVVPAESQVDLD